VAVYVASILYCGVVCAGGKGQMELRDCDATNDWRLNCPNHCRTRDDELRHFIATPAKDRIAVWGDHEAIWTGAGRDGLRLLVTSVCFDIDHTPPVCTANIYVAIRSTQRPGAETMKCAAPVFGGETHEAQELKLTTRRPT